MKLLAIRLLNIKRFKKYKLVRIFGGLGVIDVMMFSLLTLYTDIVFEGYM